MLVTEIKQLLEEINKDERRLDVEERLSIIEEEVVEVEIIIEVEVVLVMKAEVELLIDKQDKEEDERQFQDEEDLEAVKDTIIVNFYKLKHYFTYLSSKSSYPALG